MMHMTLYWGEELTLLFPWWTTESWGGYSVTLVACFMFSFLYQYMEDQRAQFKTLASAVANTPSMGAPLFAKLSRSHRLSPARLASSILYGINSALGYLLMLAIMSFNGGVLVAIVSGMTVGYYVFRSLDDASDGLVAVADTDACACS